MGKKQDMIREILRKSEHGMFASQLVRKVGGNKNTVTTSLNNMPDAYIEMWDRPRMDEPLEAVWRVIHVPENCPKP